MIETEKKYKLDKHTFDTIAKILGKPFLVTKERNVIYSGNGLTEKEVLRVRQVSDDYGLRGYTVTYKGEATNTDGIKSREEIEFRTREQTIQPFLASLNYTPVLLYEKVRTDWIHESLTVSLDELPFGYYMELEGKEETIQDVEHKFKDRFGIELDTEIYSYPELTRFYGKSVNGLVIAQFS